jgi:hypothetical protein
MKKKFSVALTAGHNLIQRVSSSMTLRQNKLECLSMKVSYWPVIFVEKERTRKEGHTNILYLDGLGLCSQTLDYHEKLQRKNTDLF